MSTPTTADGRSRRPTSAPGRPTLDRLELDLDEAERFLAPARLRPRSRGRFRGSTGRCPTGLLPRANEILRRQAGVKGSLRAALSANDRQRAFTDRVGLSSGTGLPAPAYVDFSA